MKNPDAGFSLVQTLVAVGIMAITAMVFTGVVVDQQKQIKSMGEMLAANDLQKTVATALADGSVCKYMLKDSEFDSTAVTPATPQVIDPGMPVYASVKLGSPDVLGPVVAEKNKPASAYSNSLIVKSIKMEIVEAPTPMPPAGPGATFKGIWKVSFDESKTVRSVKNLAVTSILTVDTTNPSAAKVTGCMGDLAAMSGGVYLASDLGNLFNGRSTGVVSLYEPYTAVHSASIFTANVSCTNMSCSAVINVFSGTSPDCSNAGPWSLNCQFGCVGASCFYVNFAATPFGVMVREDETNSASALVGAKVATRLYLVPWIQ